MLNRIKIWAVFLAMLAATANLSAAGSGSFNPGDGIPEGFSEAGTRAAEFLTIPVGSRGMAMGGAYGALADEISAVWWNPAGLGFLTGPQVLLTVSNQPLDVSYTYAAAAAPLAGGKLVLGGLLGVLTMGEQEITTVSQPGGTGATFGSYSMQAGASLAWNFSDRASAGINVKGIHENLAGNSQSTIAFDIGTNYHATLAGREIRLAFLIRNIGGDLAYSGNGLKIDVDPEALYPGGNIARQSRQGMRRATSFTLPTTFHIGVSYVLHQDDSHAWLAAVEVNENNNMPVSWSVGTELTRKINDKVTAALRGGLELRGDELGLESSDRLRGLSAGGGIGYDFLLFRGQIDYAWRHWGRLGAMHLFSLGLAF